MNSRFGFFVAAGLLVISLALLVVGVTAPVITIRGVLVFDGLVEVVAQAMEVKLPAEEQAKLTPEDHTKKKTVVAMLIGNFIPKDSQKEVYVQTRSIVGSVQTLYKNGAWFAATLILLFSLCIPVLKTAMLCRAMLLEDIVKRAKVLKFINAIGKWSMADVFVIAIFIAFLAAKASVGSGQAVAFLSAFGPGFYCFTGYCLVALAGQQLATAWLGTGEVVERKTRTLWQLVCGIIAAGAIVGFFLLRRKYPL